MKRLIHLAAYLYPASWRSRYGREFEALIDDMNPGFGDLLNVMKEALLMRFSRSEPLLHVVSCAALGMCAAAAIYAATPQLYTSTATIEIMAGDRATPPTRVASLAFSSRNLNRIIEEMSLYPGERSGQAGEYVIRRFREDIYVTHIARRKGPVRTEDVKNGQNTAHLSDRGVLRLSFTYSDPLRAQKVLARLASLVIDANLRTVSDAAAGQATTNDWISHAARYRVTSAPQQATVGTHLSVILSLGLGAGALAGFALAALRRRLPGRAG